MHRSLALFDFADSSVHAAKTHCMAKESRIYPEAAAIG